MSVKRVKIEIIEDSPVVTESTAVTTQTTEVEEEEDAEIVVQLDDENAAIDNADELNETADITEMEEDTGEEEGEAEEGEAEEEDESAEVNDSTEVNESAEAEDETEIPDEGVAEGETEDNSKITEEEQVSRVFMRNCHKLSTEKAATILSNALDGRLDSNKISTASPVEPKGGDVYLVLISAVGEKRHVLQDGFYWRHDGNKKYPKSFSGYMKLEHNAEKKKKSSRSNFINVIKSIYKIRDTRSERGFSGTFQRHTYMPLGQEEYIVIHYIGDEKNIQPESYRGVVPVRAYRRSMILTPKDHQRVATSCFNCLVAPDDVFLRASHAKMTGKLNEKKMDVVTVRKEMTIIQAVEEIMEGVVTVNMMKKYCGSFMCHDCALILRQAINRKTEAETSLRELHRRIDKVTNEERRKYYREHYASDKNGRCWGCMLEFKCSTDKKKEKYGRHCLQMSLISGMSVIDGIETMLEDEAESLFGLSPKRLFICKPCFMYMRSVVRAQCSYDNLQSQFTRRTHPHSLMAELQGIVPDSDEFMVPPLNDSDLDNYDEDNDLDEDLNEVHDIESDGNEDGKRKRSGDFSTSTPSGKRVKIDGSEDDTAGEDVAVITEKTADDGGQTITVRLTAIKSKEDQEETESPIKLSSSMKGNETSPVSREKHGFIRTAVSSDRWTLTYNSSCPGATGLVRLMLEVTGVQYVDEAMPDSQILPYPILPIIRKGDIEISHPLVICKYLGEEYGLCPESAEDKLLAEQIAQNCQEYLREGQFGLSGNIMTERDSEFKERQYVYHDRFVKDRQPMWLTYFEQCLQLNKDKKRFLFGSALCYADVALYQVLQATQYQFPTQYTDASYIPLLKGYCVRVGDVAKIKAYHKSSRYQGIASYKF